jgi:hypothetical protein
MQRVAAIGCVVVTLLAAKLSAEERASGGVQPIFVGHGVLLAFEHITTIDAAVEWPIESVALSNGAAIVQLDREHKRLSVRWREARPCVATIKGAGHEYQILLVPDAPSGPREGLAAVHGMTKEEFDATNRRPRPQVVKEVKVRPAIFQENKLGTANIGNLAYDARWSNYGQYLQKMIETVQSQWERILSESRLQPVAGAAVKVVFRINSDGRIAQVVSVDGDAGKQASAACTSAITARAPYGEWTEDMRAVLGSSQELTLTFFFQ